MPLEIRELTIKVNVNQPRAGGGEGSSEPLTEQSGLDKTDADKVTRNAVEQVIDIMEKKRER